MRTDYTEVTELPGRGLNAEQMERFVHRYAVAAALTTGRTLEVACGPAIGLGALEADGRPVAGLDYTPTVLSEAQSHYQHRLSLVCADSQTLPAAAAVFDAVLCLEAIYYFPNPMAFLAEARRVLTPGGSLLVGSSNPDWPHFVPGNLTRHYPTAPELADWLRTVGFAEVQMYGAVAVHQASKRHALVSRLRRLLLGSRLRPFIGPVMERLKPLAYGRLAPLPAELPLHTLRSAIAALQLNPLPLDAPNRVHRVLYALGRAP